MRFIEEMLSQPPVQAFGWSLIHFIWQGALVALLLAGVMPLLRRQSANARYLAACAALALMPVLMAGTFLLSTPNARPARPSLLALEEREERDGLQTPSEAIVGRNQSSTSIEPLPPLEKRAYLSLKPLLPWAVSIWLLGVLSLSVRLAGGLIQTRRLGRRGTRGIADWREASLQRLARQLRVSKPVLILESTLVGVPTAIGWLRPLILFPASALTGLSPEQLEAILAHELAHIRRHDYLVNLIQTVIETLLFYHPAVWWVSRQIRLERENCCDDMAVAVCGDALVYARALTKVERLRKARLELAVTADGGLLMNRISRLVTAESPHSNRATGLLTCVIASLTLTAVIAGTHISPFVDSTNASNREEINPQRLEAIPSPAPPSSRLSNGAQPLARQVGERKDASEGEGRVDPSAQLPAFDQSEVPEAIREFVKALGSPDANERAVAACSLASAGDAAAIPFLIRALGDDAAIDQINCSWSGTWNPAMRSFKKPSPGEHAAIALASFGAQAVEPLIAALGNEKSSVRRNAAWAIGEVRGGISVNRRAAFESLLNALSDRDAWVRRAAAFAFGEIREHRAARALIDALSDPDYRVRDMAVYALGEMKEARAVEQLAVTLLKDENSAVRARTAWALGEIRDPQAIEALTAALNDQDERVRNRAEWAIREIKD